MTAHARNSIKTKELCQLVEVSSASAAGQSVAFWDGRRVHCRAACRHFRLLACPSACGDDVSIAAIVSPVGYAEMFVKQLITTLYSRDNYYYENNVNTRSGVEYRTCSVLLTPLRSDTDLHVVRHSS